VDVLLLVLREPGGGRRRRCRPWQAEVTSVWVNFII
jgi:hypothetical protein